MTHTVESITDRLFEMTLDDDYPDREDALNFVFETMVEDYAQKLADRITEEGLPAQIEWLLKNGATAEEIINHGDI